MTPKITRNELILSPKIDPRMVPKSPQDGPRRFKIAQDHPSSPMTIQDSLQTAPRRPKTRPKRPNMGPRLPQDATQRAPRRPKTGPRQPKTSPRQPQNSPRWFQNAQECPRMHPESIETSPQIMVAMLRPLSTFPTCPKLLQECPSQRSNKQQAASQPASQPTVRQQQQQQQQPTATTRN